jgi:hypothetical protein
MRNMHQLTKYHPAISGADSKTLFKACPLLEYWQAREQILDYCCPVGSVCAGRQAGLQVVQCKMPASPLTLMLLSTDTDF